MLIVSRQRLSTFDNSPSLSIDDKSIKHVSSTKSLGVHIDVNLSWNVHIETIAKKIESGLGALKRCRRFVPQSTLHSVFNALIQPHFHYCSVVWGHCNKTLSYKLQKLQNRAARIRAFSSSDTNAGLLFERLGWKRLESQRQIQEAVMVYKSLNGLVPTYLRSIFTDRSNDPIRTERHYRQTRYLCPVQTIQKTVLVTKVRCFGTAYDPICGKHKLSMVFELVAVNMFLSL